jgi:hypothetical protein
MPDGGNQIVASDLPDFEAFRQEWLEDVVSGSPSTVELGRRFAIKLVGQFLDVGDGASGDYVYCDGSGDGGIDIAFLDRGAEDEPSDNAEARGHCWYLVQSKFGKAFSGELTLLSEGKKVIDTLDGRRTNLSSLASGLLERLNSFRSQSSENDKIVLLFSTERPLTENERETLNDLQAIGRSRLGNFFDVEAISIKTIYDRLRDQPVGTDAKITIPLPGHLKEAGGDLLVGSVTLTALYNFLRRYRDDTQDLDQIYEKNVRRFLGARGRVNKGIQATLKDAPERFGLYNNGITIVVSDWQPIDGQYVLAEPYIVNGCQTSRTLWEVFHQRFDCGGTGSNAELEDWKRRAESGIVVVKVVKVGPEGEGLLQQITRYTNSQNAVREKDFIALTNDFKNWQRQLAENRELYLEIQRGGWESQKALQKQGKSKTVFNQYANATDLIKVIGAGWLGEAGMAFGKNGPFLPNGSAFKRIVEYTDDDAAFGEADLFAAYLLQREALTLGFGRGATAATRRQSRFVFYMVFVDLLKDVMIRQLGYSPSRQQISDAIIRLAANESKDAMSALCDQAAEVIDTYFTQGGELSVFDEDEFTNIFNANLNSFLKSERFGKADTCKKFRQLLEITKMGMGRKIGQFPPVREIIGTVISDA